MYRLDGKVAIITGAARGQGEATARLFVEQGAKVVLTDILDAEGEAAAAAIGAGAGYLHHDVTSEADWAAVADKVATTHGGIDILVNNAGVTNATPLLDLTREGFTRTFEINLLSVFLGMRTVVPHMLKAGRGAIVNISSVNGLRGTSSCAAYDAAKWGVRGITKSVALEFGARGIRANSIHPGAIDTPMLNPNGDLDGSEVARMFSLPNGRVGAPIEVAHGTLFLASDEASYVNGAELAIDGGWTSGLSLGGIENYR